MRNWWFIETSSLSLNSSILHISVFRPLSVVELYDAPHPLPTKIFWAKIITRFVEKRKLNSYQFRSMRPVEVVLNKKYLFGIFCWEGFLKTYVLSKCGSNLWRDFLYSSDPVLIGTRDQFWIDNIYRYIFREGFNISKI